MERDPTDEHDFTLAKVRIELDKLAEQRLTSAPSAQELARWQELVTIEERLLARQREQEGDRQRRP